MFLYNSYNQKCQSSLSFSSEQNMYVVIVFKMRDITSGSFHCFQVTKKSIYSYINLSSVFNTEYGTCTYICMNSRLNHITLRHHILHQFYFAANWHYKYTHFYLLMQVEYFLALLLFSRKESGSVLFFNLYIFGFLFSPNVFHVRSFQILKRWKNLDQILHS